MFIAIAEVVSATRTADGRVGVSDVFIEVATYFLLPLFFFDLGLP